MRVPSRRSVLPALSFLAAVTAGPAPASAQGTLPPCGPSSPAVTIFGLSPRSDYRERNEFELGAPSDTTAIQTGPIELTMRDEESGEVFYRDRPADESGTYFVVLDPGDGPAIVQLSYDESQEEESVCRRTVTRRVEPTGRTFRPLTYFFGSCFQRARRPRLVMLACGDAGYYLHRLRWRRWDRPVALARGVARVKTCVPFCAAGGFGEYPIRVRLSVKRTCGDDRRYYTRITVIYPRGRPAGMPPRDTSRFSCAYLTNR